MPRETETGRCRAFASEDGTQARACVPRSQGRHGQILPWGLWRDLRVSPGISGTGSLSWRAAQEPGGALQEPEPSAWWQPPRGDPKRGHRLTSTHPTSCHSLPLAETKLEPRGVSLWGREGRG